MIEKDLDKCINYANTVINYKKRELIKEFNKLNKYEGQFTYKNVVDKLLEVME